MTNPESIVPGECPCRYCPDKDLTREEIDYLCSDSVLSSWRTFSLLQRTLLFAIRFPGRKLSICKLRKVYKVNRVSKCVFENYEELCVGIAVWNS